MSRELFTKETRSERITTFHMGGRKHSKKITIQVRLDTSKLPKATKMTTRI